MKKTFYTILISFSLLASFSAIIAFTDNTNAPSSSSDSKNPIHEGNENQIKNATLSVKAFSAGVTANSFQVNSYGNVSVGSNLGPVSSVRMVVDGDIKSSSLSGTPSNNSKICAGAGGVLVRCN